MMNNTQEMKMINAPRVAYPTAHNVSIDEVKAFCAKTCKGWYTVIGYTHNTSVMTDKKNVFEPHIKFVHKINFEFPEDAAHFALYYESKTDNIHRGERFKYKKDQKFRTINRIMKENEARRRAMFGLS
jgi:hypothetical protein